jgi:hypothetical protein
MGVFVTPWSLNPRKVTWYHFTGGSVGPRATLDGRNRTRSYQDSIHGPSSL